VSTGAEFAICTNSSYQTSSAISGDIVVWTDYRNGNDDIYGYDLSTSTEFPICTNSFHQRYPDISGNVVVWQDQRNVNYDIYGYDLSTSTEFAICTDSEWQDGPAISGNVVVWGDGRNDGDCIYGARIWNANDECSSASTVTEGNSIFGTTIFATGTDISSCAFNDTKDVWYKYTAAQGGSVTIDTDGSAFDTVLSVYEGCGGAELACNDDYSMDNTQSKVVLDVVKGKDYLIRVSGFDNKKGSYNLLVTHDCPNRPESDINDDCIVNLQDVAILASEWLDCGLQSQADCP